MTMSFDELRKKYEALYGAMKEWHLVAPRAHRGHGLDHDVTVAMIAVRIAPDNRTAELAFVAGLLHSLDRTVERGNKMAVLEKLTEMVQLLPSDVTSDEKANIVRSVEGHSDLNSPDQSVLQQTLMDADRLANLMALVVIRAGQFKSDIPAVEFEFIETANPGSTYYQSASVLDDLRGNMSQLGEGQVGYMEQLRLPKAIELGRYYHGRLNLIVEMIREDHRDLGLAGVKL